MKQQTIRNLPALQWLDYEQHRTGTEHGVAGTVKVLPGLKSPQLDNERDLLVYLPPSYTAGGERYPVIYMHDGQNLFDPATSFAGEWKVDDTLEAASEKGIQAIVVGIPNMGDQRLDEYSPFEDTEHGGGGRGDEYVGFIVDTIKPIIDRDFRTLPGRESTGVAGSSMGGLISLYAFYRRPEAFGFAGVMSPALWFAEGAVLSYVGQAPFAGGKIYLDVGTGEGRRAVDDVRRLRDLLVEKGYRRNHDLLCVVEMGGRHTESAWERRLGKGLRFLLGPAPGS